MSAFIGFGLVLLCLAIVVYCALVIAARADEHAEQIANAQRRAILTPIRGFNPKE